MCHGINIINLEHAKSRLHDNPDKTLLTNNKSRRSRKDQFPLIAFSNYININNFYLIFTYCLQRTSHMLTIDHN